MLFRSQGEGNSITAGFVYRGKVPALRGKFIFGDVLRGRVFAADIAALKKADDGIPKTVAPVEEVQLFVRDASGTHDVTLRELESKTMGAEVTRSDLQISVAGDGEIFPRGGGHRLERGFNRRLFRHLRQHLLPLVLRRRHLNPAVAADRVHPGHQDVPLVAGGDDAPLIERVEPGFGHLGIANRWIGIPVHVPHALRE